VVISDRRLDLTAQAVLRAEAGELILAGPDEATVPARAALAAAAAGSV
jgi:hypothetical protein